MQEMSVSKREENKMANPQDPKKASSALPSAAKISKYPERIGGSKENFEYLTNLKAKEGSAERTEAERKRVSEEADSRKRYEEALAASKKRNEEAIAASKARMSPAPKPVAASPNKKPTFGANVTVSTKTKPKTTSTKSEPATKPMVPSNYKTYKSSSKEASDFRSNFAKARKSGAKEFTWEGRKYNTKLKGE
jgi:hypothetical protein